MATNIHMGYVGHCKIGDTGYFITGSSLNPVQTVDTPDVVAAHQMRRAWNYAKIEIGGNVTGPIHENASDIWSYAWNRTSDLDHLGTGGPDNDGGSSGAMVVEIAYYKAEGRKFNKCYINSLQISATAGDVTSFTVDFVGMEPDAGDAVERLNTDINTDTELQCAKLITWDRTYIDVAGVAFDNAQSLTLTVNNNLQRQYGIKTSAAATNNLHAIDAPAGPREITGTISLYAEGPIALGGGLFPNDGTFGADDWGDYDATDQTALTLQVGSAAAGLIIDQSFKAQFHRPEASAQTGPTIYTLNFTAVCEATA